MNPSCALHSVGNIDPFPEFVLTFDGKMDEQVSILQKILQKYWTCEGKGWAIKHSDVSQDGLFTYCLHLRKRDMVKFHLLLIGLAHTVNGKCHHLLT